MSTDSSRSRIIPGTPAVRAVQLSVNWVSARWKPGALGDARGAGYRLTQPVRPGPSIRQAGMVLPLVAIGIAALFGMAGLALDAGQAYMAKSQVQNAADAASLAGVQILKAGGNCGSVNDPATAIGAAAATAKANGFANSIPVCNAANKQVTVTLNRTVNNSGLAKLVGAQDTFNIAATGKAQLNAGGTGGVSGQPSGGGQPCAMGLSASGTGLIVANSATLNGGGCGANACAIYVNSDVEVDRADSIDAPLNIKDPGVCKSSKDPNNCGSCQAVGKATCADPFASIPKPATPSPSVCIDDNSVNDNTNIEVPVNGSRTFNPGTYCGRSGTAAIRVRNNANVHFKAGLYVIFGGGLDFENATITSDGSPSSDVGVTFYNTSDSNNYQAGGLNIKSTTTTLWAPRTGTYSGMLYMQAPSNIQVATVEAKTNSKFNGNLYLPNAMLKLQNQSTTTAGSIIAKVISFENNGTLTLTNQYFSGSCPSESPVLIQ